MDDKQLESILDDAMLCDMFHANKTSGILVPHIDALAAEIRRLRKLVDEYERYLGASS